MQLKFILSAIIGAILEFYDFVLYGIFAGVIAVVFFPASDRQAELMASFAVLGVGYFMRPLGGLLFGHIGDKYSRRRALLISLIIMGIVTALIGLLPSYSYWGLTATIILVILRMLQGIMAGGEMPGAILFLFENAPSKHKAFFGILSLVGAMFGVLLAILAATIVTNYYTDAEIQSYAWRIPFLIGLLLAIIGGYLRATLWQEPRLQTVLPIPALVLFKTYLRAIILAVLFLSMAAMFTAITSIYLVPYLTIYFHYSLHNATQVELILTSVTIFSLLLGAACVDTLKSYRHWLLIGLGVLVLVSYPLFIWMQYHPDRVITSLVIFTSLTSLVLGAEIPFLAELFTKSVRYSGLGFSHGMAFSLIGGAAPLLLNYSVVHLGVAAPGLLFAITGILAFFSVLFSPKNT